jgi:hypothetical protein
MVRHRTPVKAWQGGATVQRGSYKLYCRSATLVASANWGGRRGTEVNTFHLAYLRASRNVIFARALGDTQMRSRLRVGVHRIVRGLNSGCSCAPVRTRGRYRCSHSLQEQLTHDKEPPSSERLPQFPAHIFTPTEVVRTSLRWNLMNCSVHSETRDIDLA